MELPHSARTRPPVQLRRGRSVRGRGAESVWTRRRRCSLAGCPALALSGASAHAAPPVPAAATLFTGWIGSTPDCSAPGGAFACRLTWLLHMLYVAAGILSLLLLVVIVLAVRIYRQNNAGVRKGQP